MIVYRLSRAKYKNELSGIGAAINGQRWNSKRIEVIYTAQTRALANCEVAVHIALGILPKDFFMLEIKIPDNLKILELKPKQLPKNWNIIPFSFETQKLGDDFVKADKFAVLKVPSVVVKKEFNFIINPRHKDFKKIKIVDAEPFPFDERLFK